MFIIYNQPQKLNRSETERSHHVELKKKTREKWRPADIVREKRENCVS